MKQAILEVLGFGPQVVDEYDDMGHSDCMICKVARALVDQDKELPHGAKRVVNRLHSLNVDHKRQP